MLSPPLWDTRLGTAHDAVAAEDSIDCCRPFAAIAVEHRFAVFLELCLARIFPIRYTDLNALIRYIGVRTLTYEKYTTVLYQPVSQCLRRRRHTNFRGATFSHTGG